MLTAERLREVLTYDAETGVFTRKVATANRVCVGDVAGSPSKHGYLHICIDGRKYKAHRLAWLYVNGIWPAALIDHRDGNKTNNSIANLREATKSENGRNRAANVNNAIGLKGVSWSKLNKRWRADIALYGRRKYLGLFDTPEAAHAAYFAAAERLHGEFGRAK